MADNTTQAGGADRIFINSREDYEVRDRSERPGASKERLLAAIDKVGPMANAMTNDPLQAPDFRNPAVVLSGTVDYAMYQSFREQFTHAEGELVVIELSTLGGDPEVARMMGEDVRYHSDLQPERKIVFLGKAAIYSAGTTFMSFFARNNRYLTRGTRLMVHERKLNKVLNIDGPLTSCVATVKATLHEIEASIAIQNEGFANLVQGSNVTMAQLLEKAPFNWYIEAQEAVALGLVRAVL